MNKQVGTISPETIEALLNYDWPGNVRQLENFIERSVLLSPGPDLRVAVADLKAPAEPVATEAATLEDTEREHILAVLKQTS